MSFNQQLEASGYARDTWCRNAGLREALVTGSHPWNTENLSRDPRKPTDFCPQHKRKGSKKQGEVAWFWEQSHRKWTLEGHLKVVQPCWERAVVLLPALPAGQPSLPLSRTHAQGWVKGRRSSRPPQGGVILASKCCWTAFKAPTASVLGLEPADNLFKRLNGSLMAGIHFNL